MLSGDNNKSDEGGGRRKMLQIDKDISTIFLINRLEMLISCSLNVLVELDGLRVINRKIH